MKFSLVKLICSKGPQKDPKHPKHLSIPTVRTQIRLETEVAASLLNLDSVQARPQLKDTYFAAPNTRYMGKKPVAVTTSSAPPQASVGQVFCIGDSVSSSLSSSSAGCDSQDLDEGYSSTALSVLDPDITHVCDVAFFERSVY
ncbi:hypothetical protein PHYBLDRAFT_143417 [Phycomyces blakesleeanus NRRL 1555(-)]|uniref:Uncharacterized protein n=1 Tax=Phycomyces blakesleeanus (strain ATCC 8743b / DSM 1359 / FGSC 10004 / NBRC 33097 / NRRL 1555) TaxID=763407 RepID=A0A162PVR2_PHYB8|nr:hypothetical protein PHYBLDRAFT_143417 [Phycomyces blakesleeanus NRRL 1555(-)]OAD76447.1 hypothetical protein PHYBLDRAFT_143417 [Phycomyces blakesleeanus NRRL 1555(-)]|eukprot:XP_018294487.1 hypothetical protein PHYBLDRAFT_143417 [Phycomyces blakesleeanus NRRL 1555(-)]